MQLALCNFAPPTYIFFSDNVPSLVYYSHFSSIIIALGAGLFVFLTNRNNLASRILFYITLLFSSWVLLDSIFWASNRSDVIMFVWSLTILFEPLVHAGAFYLMYVIANKRDMPFKMKLFIAILCLPLILLVPTSHILSSFDLTSCLANETFFAYYSYVIEIFFTLWIIFFSFKKIREEIDTKRKEEISYLTTGIVLFLVCFSWGAIVGSFTDDWNIAQWGLIGVPVFIGFLSYATVSYNTFNIKVLGTEVLVVALWVFILSLLFIPELGTIRLVTIVTLLLSIFFGVLLIRSVNVEVEQKEKILEGAKALKESHRREMEKSRSEAKLRDEFVFVAAHELRTPITAIRGFLELVSETEGSYPVDVQQDLDAIKMASDHLNVLVNNLLEIARSDAGAMKIETRPVKTTAVIEDVLKEVDSLIKEKKIILKTNNFNDGMGIIADEQKMKEVFMNIISNAIKYNREGGELEISILPENDGYVIIEVRDTGFGIPKDQQEKIFGKFFRASNKDTQGVIGTGLGLFITKMLVEKMGGEITFSSVEGKGTTFALSFPRA